MPTIAYHTGSSGAAKKDTPNPETLEELIALAGNGDDVDISDDESEQNENERLLEGEDEEVVEVVDDTPDEDKGRTVAPLDSSYDDDDAQVEEELKQIKSEAARKRISALTRQRHDERRAKEAEARARIEATNYARNLYERTKELEAMLASVHKSGATAAQESATVQLETARQRLKDANESGDTDAITKAQEELQRAVLKEINAKNAQPLRIPEAPQPPNLQTVQPKTQEWVQKNPWFTKHRTATQAALDFHNEAISGGLTPETDSYYSFIDKKMKPLLDAYGLAPATSAGKEETPKKKTVDTVTPVSRSSGAAPKREAASSTKKFTLTRAQAQLATELMPHIPASEAVKRYAKELAKSSQQVR